MRNLFIFLALVGIIGVGVWGIKPSFDESYAQVGHFRLSAFPIGLAFYQQDRSFFYNISPYNDYYVDSLGRRYTFITKDDVIYGRFKTDLGEGLLKDRLDYLLTLFGRASPSITFRDSPQLSYRAQINDREIVITRQISNYSPLDNLASAGLTLGYDCRDFVFDSNKNLYSLKSEQEALAWELNKFDPPTDLVLPTWEEVAADKIFILSPTLTGIIQISAGGEQKLLINRTYCLVAVEETPFKTEGEIMDSMRIKILDNLGQINEK